MCKARIFVVEDEAIVAADLADKLRQLGYEISGTTRVGEDAIIHARERQPDMILMDIHLAGAMDGIDAAEAIVKECDIPILYLTAHSDRATLERAKLTEPFGFLLKPFDDSKLEVHIEMALYKHRQDRKLRRAYEELDLLVEKRTCELQQTQKQFLHAEKLSAIGRLSASIAHEFNNPLQGILSIIKGVKKRAIMEDEDRVLLDAAIDEGNRMKDLIRSLQDFNRPSSHSVTIVDVNRNLDSLLVLQKSDFNTRRISVVKEYAEDLPFIRAISDQIKQVFLNLLANAADACQQSDGVITVRTWQENENVAVMIKDNGIGIKAEDMEHIFQPFFTTKPEIKGTGLGLSVCYGIIRKHNGEIRVESQPGEGTTFIILLPIKGNKRLHQSEIMLNSDHG